MNDRFRFRAWNVCDDDLIGGMLYDVQDETDFDYFLDSKKLVVEQCTGLKDENGTLIYEGDIISATTFDGHNRQFIVKYANEDACFGLFITKSMYISFNKVYDDSLQIIGNIHENPELLEDK